MITQSSSGARTVHLPPRVSVRECAALKQQLLALIACADSVLIDIAKVEIIDTAAMQLLFAFGETRIAGGLSTSWHGDNQTLRNAASALGLKLSDFTGCAAHSTCEHDS